MSKVPTVKHRKVSFKAGDTIFYPAHGVAKVLGVEERQFGEFTEEFFILELNRGGRSLVPTKNIDQAGLRALISARRAKELIKSMRDQPTIDKSKSWKDRASKYSEGLKTGDPVEYTKILQELMFRARADKLSTTETKMLETARSYFLAEVGDVLDISPEKLEAQLVEAIATLLPDVAPASGLDDEDEDFDEEDDESEEDSELDDDEEGGAAGKKKATKKKAAKKTTKKKTSKKTAKKTKKK